MKYFITFILVISAATIKAQTPQLHIPAATMVNAQENMICSDGTTLYYVSKNNSTNVLSLYKINGSSTTPVFVKDLFRTDTANVIQPLSGTGFEKKMNSVACVNGTFYLLYAAGFNGWRLLTSDGTAAGTLVSIVSNEGLLSTPSFTTTGLYKTDDGVYVLSFGFPSGTPSVSVGRWYKSMGTPATSGLAFNTPVSESAGGQTKFNIAVKDNFIYFSTNKYTGITATHTRYYRTNGTTTELIKEVPYFLGAQFCVGQNDMLITFGSTYFNTTLGLNIGAPGYKIISLADFSELATFNPPSSASPQANGTFENFYDNYVTTINGTYYIQGFQNFNRGLYLLKADNSISFWQMPLNTAAPNTAGFGDIEVKRTDNRVYFTQFYSTHNYTGTVIPATGYSPLNARTSSMYYVTGTNPVLVDSLNALEGRFFNDMDYCGDVLYGETRYNSIYLSGGSPLQQRKLWRTDGTTVGSGFYSNLYDCTPQFGFYLGDIYPNGFVKHDWQLYFLGRTGCTFADQNNALYRLSQCSDALAMFKSATSGTTTSNANYTEGSRVLPYATNKPDSALVAVYPNGLSLGTISATVYNEANNVVAGGYTFLRRHYVINPATDPAGNKKVRLYFSAADFAALQIADPTITSINQLQVVKYDGPTEDGTYDASDATSLTTIPPSSITTGTEYGVNYLEFDVTGFSEFWISKANAALPVDITLFTGKLKNDNDVQLQWKTENEINVKEYQLQSSDDGINFKPAATIAANKALVYNYTDAAVQFTKAAKYYRLKILDNDGRFKYSAMIRINRVSSTAITIYPNPASTYIIATTATTVQQIKITDAAGKLVLQFRGTLGNRYNIAPLSKGLYTLQIFLANEVVAQKLLVQ